MPHMQRITWSGIALHAGVVPGYRASHGCIRLPASFAKSLFGLTKIGNRVVVTHDEVDPIAFDHPTLFKPLPAETPQSSGSRPAPESRPRLRVNDTGRSTPVGLSEMPKFLGVSPALAEAARDPNRFSPPDRPRSRAEADRAAARQSRQTASDAENRRSRKELPPAKKPSCAVRGRRSRQPQIAAANQMLGAIARGNRQWPTESAKRALRDLRRFHDRSGDRSRAAKRSPRKLVTARRTAKPISKMPFWM